MPPKRKGIPPVRPNADGSGFVKVGGKQFSSLKQPKSSKITAKEDSLSNVIDCVGDVGAFTIPIKATSGVLGGSCWFHPSLCRSHQIEPHSVVSVAGSDSVLLLEAEVKTSISSKFVYLGENTAALLGNDMVSVKKLEPSESVPILTSVKIYPTVEVKKLNEQFIPSPSSFVEWCSLFRNHFRHRLVFVGMVDPIMWCSRTVTISVEAVASKDSSVRCGVLTDSTVIECADFNNTVSEKTEVKKVQHTLFLGERGCGKTFQLNKEGREDAQSRSVFTIAVEELPQGEGSEVSTATVLQEIFEKATLNTPSTVLLDDLHLICNRHSPSSQWVSFLLSSIICNQILHWKETNTDVRLIATATEKEALVPNLLSEDCLGSCIRLLTPPDTVEERVGCLTRCFEDLQVPVDTALRAGLSEVAKNCHAYTPRDLYRLADAAVVHAVMETGTSQVVTVDHLLEAAQEVRPLSLRQFDVSIPSVKWEDIGGSEEAKKTLKDVVSWCLGRASWIFEAFPISPPKGVLLFGPPGCSKTMLAKALANESGLNFISIKGPEVFSKWVGDSEKAVRDIFVRARNASPCIVFIDELDGMCGHRGSGGVSDRVISQFLTELDGLPSALSDKPNALIFVAATNRPDSIDGAVLRPGRIDRCVYVGLPTLKERAAIAQIHFKKIPVQKELTADYVAQRTEGYTGAEVVAVVKEAALLAVTEDSNAECLLTRHVDDALGKIKPRIRPEDVEWYKNWSTKK